MSTWSDESRKNRAADAEQKRLDADARAARRRADRAAEDTRRRENAAADRAASRADKLQRRRDRRDRRRERAQAWTKNTTPANVYRRGTLALVTASALASLPAQVAHFAGISLSLLPVPFALEGAAWVMAAGVAYADEKGLPAWVRWMLRALALAAAGYASSINYAYGTSLPGLTPSQAHTAGYGLAAVTLGGPLLFEIRQWVMTLSAGGRTRAQRAEEKARAQHTRRRRKDHKNVVKLADKLISAAPYGSLAPEAAFRTAWEITTGIRQPGMTPALYAQAVTARKALAQSLAEQSPEPAEPKEMSPEAVAVELFLAEAFGPGDGDGGTPVATPPDGPKNGPQNAGGTERQTGSARAPKRRTPLGGKGKRGSAEDSERPLAEADLAKVRALAAAHGGADKLSARLVRQAVGCRNDYAVRLRDAVQAEAAGADSENPAD